MTDVMDRTETDIRGWILVTAERLFSGSYLAVTQRSRMSAPCPMGDIGPNMIGYGRRALRR